jgi:hypothetical protein
MGPAPDTSEQAIADALAFAQAAWADLWGTGRAAALDRRHFQAALAIRRHTGSLAQIAAALHHLASVIRWKLHDDRTANDLYQQALTHARQAGDPIMTATALMPLGTLALDRGDLTECHTCLTEGLTLSATRTSPQPSPWRSNSSSPSPPPKAILTGPRSSPRRQPPTANGSAPPNGPEMPAWAHRHLAAARHALTGCAAAAATAEGTTMTLPQAIHYALTTNPPG